MKLFNTALVTAALAGCMGAAVADEVTLNFEDINIVYPFTPFASIQNFYNGGTSNQGTSGTNYGVSFSPNALALCLNTPGTTCSNTSRGGLAPGSDEGALFFDSGTAAIMNVAAGFTTGLTFEYSSPDFAGSAQIYDGLDGTGNLLATISLSTNPGSCPGFDAAFCPFTLAGANFVGTARSVSFGGVVNEIVFDDVTFGVASSTGGGGGGAGGGGPSNVPEPAVASLMLAGLGLAALIARRRGDARPWRSSLARA
jgi:hypothetical protein